jgi:hypothetical protein
MESATDPSSLASTPREDASLCLVPGLEIEASGTAKDAIPALSNPALVAPGDEGTTHLAPGELVIGMVVEGEALAIPRSIMWWHEIVNLDRLGTSLAITYCPLTGTAMAFDRTAIRGRELGVSGVLLENNLVMYDRTGDESLWAQMLGGAICGSAKGDALPRMPLIVMTYEGWQALHPDTKVVSSDTGFSRNYTVNPYADYEKIDAPPLFETVNNRDRRRLPKELVVGIPTEAGGVAVPFGVLEADEVGRVAVNLELDGEAVVVLWYGAIRGAATYSTTPLWAADYDPPEVEGLSFQAEADGYRDLETGSLWNVEGLAVSGPAEGSRLSMIPDALVAYWFAWSTFNPDTDIVGSLD